MTEPEIEVVVVGSIGIDTITTPTSRRADVLGGSASFACAAAAKFARTGMVGVVGDDFPVAGRDQYAALGIDVSGLQQVAGKTFRWSGKYEANMDVRHTLVTELNVLEQFDPVLPPAYRRAPFLFLANGAPDRQLRAWKQMEQPQFVAMDTMDLWINIAIDDLRAMIRKVDLLTLNESEARHLTGVHALPAAAAQLLTMGPQYVLIKKGEHGSMCFSSAGTRLLPAYPLGAVQDPTGAGDAFAGGVMGALARAGTVTLDALGEAMCWGSVVASFAVESFSLDRLVEVSRATMEARLAEYRRMLMA